MRMTIKGMALAMVATIGLSAAGLAPRTEACGPYGDPIEMAGWSVEASQDHFQEAAARLDAALARKDPTATRRAIKELREARASLQSARERLERLTRQQEEIQKEQQQAALKAR